MDPAAAQIAFFRKFAHLYDSGIGLTEALDLARGAIDGSLRAAVGHVIDDIYRGTSLADALGAWPDSFPVDVVALVRAGEHRGELSAAARSAADGLSGGVLDPSRPDEEAGEALLMAAGDARVLHVSDDGSVQSRTADGKLTDVDAAPAGAIAALRQRGPAFLWQDRLIRIDGNEAHLVVRLSGLPMEDTDAVRKWREGEGGLLVLLGDRRADFDAALRGVLRAFENRVRVAVDLPVPEAVPAADFAHALRLDPDVIALRYPSGEIPTDVHVVVASTVPIDGAVATVAIG